MVDTKIIYDYDLLAPLTQKALARNELNNTCLPKRTQLTAQKMKFPLKDFLVNTNNSPENCVFAYIY